MPYRQPNFHNPYKLCPEHSESTEQQNNMEFRQLQAPSDVEIQRCRKGTPDGVRDHKPDGVAAPDGD
jgi:hypothetical protein